MPVHALEQPASRLSRMPRSLSADVPELNTMHYVNEGVGPGATLGDTSSRGLAEEQCLFRVGLHSLPIKQGGIGKATGAQGFASLHISYH